MADDAGQVKEKKEPVFTVASGIAFGEHKGHVVHRIPRATNPASRKGTKSKRVAVIREITREVCGLAPYEKRCMDMIKLLGGSADKKVYKLLKKRLGTHRRGMIKRELVKRLAQRMRAQGKM